MQMQKEREKRKKEEQELAYSVSGEGSKHQGIWVVVAPQGGSQPKDAVGSSRRPAGPPCVLTQRPGGKSGCH